MDGAFLSWNDLQAAVSQVNAQVQEETDREWSPGQGDDGPTRIAPPFSHKSGPSAHLTFPFPEVLAVSLINEALDQDNPEKTLSSLLLPAAGLDDISLPVATRYHVLLVAAKRRKAQVRFGLAGLVTSTGRISHAQYAPWESQSAGHGPFWGWEAGGSDLALGKLTAQSDRWTPCVWEGHRSGGLRTQATLPALTLSDHVTYSKSLTSLSSPYTSVKYYMPWSYLPTGMGVKNQVS